jgi:hypothetical protein
MDIGGVYLCTAGDCRLFTQGQRHNQTVSVIALVNVIPVSWKGRPLTRTPVSVLEQVTLRRIGNGAVYVYVGGTGNFKERDGAKLANLPHGVEWHNYGRPRGNRKKGRRFLLVTEGMGYAQPGQPQTQDELYRISATEVFLIAGEV